MKSSYWWTHPDRYDELVTTQGVTVKLSGLGDVVKRLRTDIRAHLKDLTFGADCDRIVDLTRRREDRNNTNAGFTGIVDLGGKTLAALYSSDQLGTFFVVVAVTNMLVRDSQASTSRMARFRRMPCASICAEPDTCSTSS